MKGELKIDPTNMPRRITRSMTGTLPSRKPAAVSEFTSDTVVAKHKVTKEAATKEPKVTNQRAVKKRAAKGKQRATEPVQEPADAETSAIVSGYIIPHLSPATYPDVWCQIFAFVDIRDLLQLSMTCRHFYQIISHLWLWTNILSTLGKQIKKGKSPMYQVMAIQHKRGLCERCHTTGAPSGSGGVVKMKFKPELDMRAQDLCLQCRRGLLSKEVEPDWHPFGFSRMITHSRTSGQLHFDPDNYGLNFVTARNPIHRRFAAMRLFDTADVQETALQVHGGFCGLQAAIQKSKRTRETRAANKRLKRQRQHEEQRAAAQSSALAQAHPASSPPPQVIPTALALPMPPAIQPAHAMSSAHTLPPYQTIPVSPSHLPVTFPMI
ncbi:hypothetical protein DM01DRAFT_1143353 [Hesseltinella vesiculosa]|uniref:F-box domain-containing protein n=1 Tax=Hesseltinella vesiculosa TaxID=101127 RepID=A0A1X2G7U8_9FUNG|nr:hypothetical protein DM01DRAFT_1143353 [Hesseltinella vesiculosa]